MYQDINKAQSFKSHYKITSALLNKNLPARRLKIKNLLNNKLFSKQIHNTKQFSEYKCVMEKQNSTLFQLRPLFLLMRYCKSSECCKEQNCCDFIILC